MVTFDYKIDSNALEKSIVKLFTLMSSLRFFDVSF